MNIQIPAIPQSLAELTAMPQSGLRTPEDAAALTVAALCAYPRSPEDCHRMLDYLRGPRPLSPMEKQFLRDRFMDGRDYIPRSYFQGAAPENDYTPALPLTLCFTRSPAQTAEEGYIILQVRSGGADSPRSVTLRRKPSTDQWFLWEHTLLGGIREPVSRDPWA